jgi:predicted Rossmann fold nucleotide-binding protein DprA/Smf involved in DNA uptake
MINEKPVLLDDMIRETNLSVPVASDILLRLQLKKLIKQLPGKQFIRN